MAKFSKEDADGNLNVHEMQTMWFENHCGNAHLRNKNYKDALKQFNYIQQHLSQFKSDFFDFHYFSFRKVTINHYCQMLEYSKTLYKGKYPIRGCLGMMRAVSKIQKHEAKNLNEIKEKFEAHKATPEY